MLQHEDIAKTQELKGKFTKVWVSSEYLQSHLNILGFDKIKSRFSWCKKAGFSFESLISTLLILPLLGVNSIYGLTANKGTELSKCGKDSYYRILANQKINWRAFLAQFVKQYLLKDELFFTSLESTNLIRSYIATCEKSRVSPALASSRNSP